MCSVFTFVQYMFSVPITTYNLSQPAATANSLNQDQTAQNSHKNISCFNTLVYLVVYRSQKKKNFEINKKKIPFLVTEVFNRVGKPTFSFVHVKSGRRQLPVSYA